MEVAGIPREAPPVDKSVLDIKREYYTTDGKRWEGGTLDEGDSLIVLLTVKTSEKMPDALVTDLLPAGLEIENFNLGDAKQWAGVVIDGIEIAEPRPRGRGPPRGVPRRPLRRRAQARPLRHRAPVLPRARGDAGHVCGAAAAGRRHVPAGDARHRASARRRRSR